MTHLRITCLLIPAAFFCYLQLSEAFANYKIDCCTEYRDHVSKRILNRVEKYRIQRADGICDVRAVVLRMKHKTICVNPQNRNVLKWIKKKDKKDKCKKSSKCNKRLKKNRSRKNSSKPKNISRNPKEPKVK